MKMNVEQFAAQIRKENRFDRNKSIIAMVGFWAFSYCVIFTSGEESRAYLLMGEFLTFLTACNVGLCQWNRYLSYHQGILSVRMRKSLSDVVRLQAFQTEDYFSYIRKKMYPSAICLGLGSLVMAILKATSDENIAFSWKMFAIMIFFGVLNVWSPFLVGIGMKKYWMYKSHMGNKGKLTMFLLVFEQIYQILEMLVLVASIVVGSFFCWIIVWALTSAKIKESIAVLQSQTTIYSTLLLLMAVMSFLWAVYIWRMKKYDKFIGILSVILFVASLLTLFVESNTYSNFSEENITVHTLQNEKNYQLNDVEHFVIYNQDDSLQMKLYLKDGTTIKVLGASRSYSTLYVKTYPSEYHFIADYILWLQEAGATGTMEDMNAKQLQQSMMDLDIVSQQGMEKIMEEMK
jgi:hypothetical protein